MKREGLIILSICLFLVFVQSCCKKQIKDLTKIETQDYINKPVEELLSDIGRPYQEYQFISEPPGVLSGCVFVYDNDQCLKVYLTKKLSYLDEYNEKMDWDIDLFKKERIGSIRIEKLKKP
jgi:hypothetical protein